MAHVKLQDARRYGRVQCAKRNGRVFPLNHRERLVDDAHADRRLHRFAVGIGYPNKKFCLVARSILFLLWRDGDGELPALLVKAQLWEIPEVRRRIEGTVVEPDNRVIDVRNVRLLKGDGER